MAKKGYKFESKYQVNFYLDPSQFKYEAIYNNPVPIKLQYSLIYKY